MARTPQILDQYGRPIRLKDLKGEQAGPDSSPIRTLTELASSKAMSPTELAHLLDAAAYGDLYSQARLFEAMEDKDSHILAEMGKRKRAIAGLDWEILPWDDSSEQANMAEFIEGAFSSLDMEGTILEMADAIGKGIKAIEIIWDTSSGQWTPVGLEPRPLEWFEWRMGRFGRIDELRLKSDSMEGEELIPGKWIVHRHPAKSGSPFKAPLFRTLAWLFLFRNYSIKAWMQFLETFGIPIMVGKYPVGSPERDRDILLDALDSIATRAAVAIPDGMDVEIKELSMRIGNAPLHQGLLDWAAKEISKAILGQTLTTDTQGKGSYALGQVHNEVRYDILRHDARLVSNTIQQDLIRPICLLNFGQGDQIPYFRLTVRKPEDLKYEAETLKTLTESGFTQIPTWWIREKFNIPAPQEGDETLADLIRGAQSAQNRSRGLNLYPGIGQGHISQNRRTRGENSAKSRARFTPEQEEIERFIELIMEEGQKVLNGPEGQILNAILGAVDYEDAMTRILELYPGLDTNRLQDALQRGILNANLFGQYVADATMEDGE